MLNYFLKQNQNTNKMSEIIKTPLSALVRSRKIAAISKLHFNTNG